MTIYFFYFFSFLVISSSVLVIFSNNAVHSVLFLIFTFFNSAILFILMNAEFLAMTIVIVYVGAIAVLFLFVVMMLNIAESAIKEGFLKYFPFGLILIVIFISELFLVFNFDSFKIPENIKIDNKFSRGLNWHKKLNGNYILYLLKDSDQLDNTCQRFFINSKTSSAK